MNFDALMTDRRTVKHMRNFGFPKLEISNDDISIASYNCTHRYDPATLIEYEYASDADQARQTNDLERLSASLVLRCDLMTAAAGAAASKAAGAAEVVTVAAAAAVKDEDVKNTIPPPASVRATTRTDWSGGRPCTSLLTQYRQMVQQPL